MSQRRFPLLKNEIEAVQKSLLGECYYTDDYINNLVKRLEDLKRLWYKNGGKN